MFKYFKWSFAFLIGGMVLAFWRGESMQAGLGFKDLVAAIIITSLEISLSFDNAVINATKLTKMSKVWQKRFLTWGIAIAVFGMRFVFPIAIVAVFSGISCRKVLYLALNKPDEYAMHLEEANVGISSFGGAFLLMLFLEFMFDQNKRIFWLGALEKLLKKVGQIRFAPTLIATVALAAIQPMLAPEDRMFSIISGAAGILIHLAIHGASVKLEKMAQHQSAFALKHSGLVAFLYLELIDASFSLDGVLGAFALTKDVVIIAIGLAVGAFFVRSLTIVLVEKKTLDKLIYLTHGAYWAIGSLATIMYISTFYEVPEIITGVLGMALILASFFASLNHNRKLRKQ